MNIIRYLIVQTFVGYLGVRVQGLLHEGEDETETDSIDTLSG